VAGRREKAEGEVVSEFEDWEDLRAELHDGDEEALAAERAQTEAWISAYHLAESASDWA
jgi:hypothetical protein